ncbi:xanthine dehydrogenase family protein subunit M [Bradyrhizobium viridifuturi]|jgi:carbon-monoxide dehydrogenase medium subunit|uniref:FAD binding domain-containing protein n=3 Tax=Pseudomonadota TaxID=1224 RepID=UPI000396D8B3|nr:MULTISPECIES: xanthine dehydrogenase family protein subunit M [Bradyrhizobium]ERF85460.1 MAG: carbon-monoxide dehydrogenase medium subunit [Bradyrhizobium sp. DFCI-1]OYU64279.1 MAG: molybdopterin dehydrogenase [Bradyrhizobium sp. PARBB1]PSO25719.1 xanthine dehydrogenase family protein subunit M [Bradyrhizobium sp. MOS004]QRI67792.1 xanthine dehydrogenase family protein subunit M [Bradyrhizobium sp. PSBB068]MBR1018475.1 xanthine dehydrogenase family protein subunit M [Bradyrhizobium viridifu
MKAAAFAYARATSVVNALELLAAHGDRAKVLSGGQSLMPAMNLRLLSPELLVDIGGLAELRGIALKGDVLVVGALTRYVDLLRSPEIALHAPLLLNAVSHVAHPAIRNRGTIGGSLAHADPASELPACVVALDAAIVARGPTGERRIAATEFFKGIYETALSPDELLVAVEVPIAGQGSTYFFQEYARRHGDYAVVGLAARAVVAAGRFSDLRLGFFAVGERPLLATAAAKLINASVTPALLAEAATALADELEPQEDQQASPAMRRHLATVLLRRCVAALLARSELDAGGAR